MNPPPFAVYAQQQDFAMSHFEVFNAFFTEMLGSLDDYNNLETVSYPLQYFYFLVTSLILTVAMLNMLISIISETYGKVREAEDKTRTYELLNILTEIDIIDNEEDASEATEEDGKKLEYLMYISNEVKKEGEIADVAEIVKLQNETLQTLESDFASLKAKVRGHIKEQRVLAEENFKRLKKIIL